MSKLNPRVRLTRSCAAEEAASLSPSKSPSKSPVELGNTEQCFVCGDNNIATQGQAISLYLRQAALFEKYLLSPDFLPTLKLSPQVIKGMRNNTEYAACGHCLSFIKELWDFQQQIKALENDILNVMEKTRASLLLRKRTSVTKEGASKKSLTSSIVVPDFEVEMEIGNEEVRMEEENENHQNIDDFEDDNSGIAFEDELESNSVQENNDIKDGDVGKNSTRKSKIKALQFIKESGLKHDSPSKSENLNEKYDLEHDADSSEDSSDTDSEDKNDDRPIFECGDENCDKKYKSKYRLNQHRRRFHLGEKNVDCEHCDEKFFNSVDKSKHIKTKHGMIPENSVQCLKCEKWLSSPKNLIAHQAIVCGFDIAEDILKEHSIKLIYCEQCPKKFIKKCDLERHLGVHSVPTIFCTKCGKGYSHISSLAAHEKLNCGTSPPKFECRNCHKILATRRNQLVHEVKLCNLEVDQEELRKYQIKFKNCDFCELIFSRPSDLIKHRRTHTKDKRFPCQKGCGKSFSDENYARIHGKTVCSSTEQDEDFKERRMERLKLSRKPQKRVSCGQCKKRFYTEEKLDLHKNKCRGIVSNLVNCQICHKSISRLSLAKHNLRLHENISCPYVDCQQVSSGRKAYKKHIKVVHKEVDESNSE